MGAAGWLALAVSAVGLALRIEHACTFNNVKHGADYDRHVAGVDWMMHHWRPFDFTPDISWTISYQAPLWYAVGALLKSLFHATRPLAGIAVVGWVGRQYFLNRLVKQSIPAYPWIRLIALTLGAFLPIAVDTDGTINPEALHSSIFAIAAYWLWRMEQDARRPTGIGKATAATFGVVAGLGLLTKATSGLLPLAAVLLVCWQLTHALRHGFTWRDCWKRLLLPNLIAGFAWCAVVGWWCGPNLLKYGHPFPHAWDLHPPDDMPEFKLPIFYRRPLGWALPFDWRPWLDEPMQQSFLVPRPNAWAQFVTGTWSDLINRGMCRLHGGGLTTKYFDGWPVSGRCIELLSVLAHIGLFMTVLTLCLLLRTAWNYLRSSGQKGSLALPMIAVLGFGFTFAFTLTYPVDGMVSTNARYLLPISLPMMACLGIGLKEIERRQLRRVFVTLVGGLVAIVAVLVTYERWGS